jgi:Receptor family ligand binding region
MRSVGKLAAYWNTPMSSYWSIDGDLADTTIYKTLVRVSPTLSQLSGALMVLLKNYNWNNVALLGDTSAESQAILDGVQDAIARDDVATVLKRLVVNPGRTAETSFYYEGDMQSVLKQANASARGMPLV